MRHKSFDEYKKWYIGAVKSHLILRSGYMEEDADEAVRSYRLEQKINECPEIACHCDPKSIAREIKEHYYNG